MVHNMYVKDRFLAQMLAGQKRIDIRLGFHQRRKIRTGHFVRFRSSTREAPLMRIIDVRRYDDLTTLLLCEKDNLHLITPGMNEQEAVEQGERMFPTRKVRKCGLMAIQFQPVQ